MIKLVKTKSWLWSLLELVVLLLVTGGIAFAAVSVNKTMPAAVTVNLQSSPEGALGFYSDAAGTVGITTLNFGELKPGVTGMVKIWVKNLTGGTTFRYFTAADDLLKGSATISPYEAGAPNYLPPGQLKPFDIFLNLDPDIAVGAYQFTITINAAAQ